VGHRADGWEEVLLPEMERQPQNGKEVTFRADAAYAKPDIYEALEERGVNFAIRIPANDNLERDIAELPTRPTCVAPRGTIRGRRIGCLPIHSPPRVTGGIPTART